MMPNDDNAIREVELVYEDEPVSGAASSGASGSGAPSSAAPRFAQSSSGASSSSDEQVWVRRRTQRRGHADPSDVRMRASFEHDDDFVAQTRSVALTSVRVSTSVLFGALGGVAITGIGAASASSVWAVPGVTIPLAGAALLTTWATVVMTLFSSFGALAITGVTWLAMRRFSGRSKALALVVSMWAAWILTGIVSFIAFGPVPYLSVPVAFTTALTVGVSAVVGSRRWVLLLVGSVVVVGAGVLLVAAGSATGVGALASAVTGGVSALLGVRLWNRFWAPVIDANNRFRAKVRSSWNTRAA